MNGPWRFFRVMSCPERWPAKGGGGFRLYGRCLFILCRFYPLFGGLNLVQPIHSISPVETPLTNNLCRAGRKSSLLSVSPISPGILRLRNNPLRPPRTKSFLLQQPYRPTPLAQLLPRLNMPIPNRTLNPFQAPRRHTKLPLPLDRLPIPWHKVRASRQSQV